MDFLKLTPGSVTPLGLLNDTEHKVKFFLDKDFLEKPELIGIHPNENTATVWLKTADLVRLIEGHGNAVELTCFYKTLRVFFHNFINVIGYRL